MRFTIERRFNAPREVVYEAFTDLARLPDRIEAIDRIEPENEGEPLRFQDGSAFRETRTIMGKQATETMRIEDVLPQQRFTLTSESHGCAYRFEHTFREGAGSCTVTLEGECRPTTLGARIMMVVFFPMRGMMPKLINKDFAAIHASLESAPDA